MEWSLNPGVTFTGKEGELYEFEVEAMLPDSANNKLHVFSATIKLFHRKERSEILLGIEVKDC